MKKDEKVFLALIITLIGALYVTNNVKCSGMELIIFMILIFAFSCGILNLNKIKLKIPTFKEVSEKKPKKMKSYVVIFIVITMLELLVAWMQSQGMYVDMTIIGYLTVGWICSLFYVMICA